MLPSLQVGQGGYLPTGVVWESREAIGLPGCVLPITFTNRLATDRVVIAFAPTVRDNCGPIIVHVEHNVIGVMYVE